MLEKSFLVQRFAKLGFGAYHVVGYSVAGEETVCQIPELNVCFDIGRCPYFALTSDIVCITHGHMDHMAGLAYYLSQRYFQGMKPGTVLLPRELERPVDRMLKRWRDVERQGTPYKLVPMTPGQTYEVRRDFGIRASRRTTAARAWATALISIREKLKPEYMGTPGPGAGARCGRAASRSSTARGAAGRRSSATRRAGRVFEQPDVSNAEILITECTFFDPDHKTKAKAGRHLHVDQFVEVLPKLKNQHIVVDARHPPHGHPPGQAPAAEAVGDERMKRRPLPDGLRGRDGRGGGGRGGAAAGGYSNRLSGFGAIFVYNWVRAV